MILARSFSFTTALKRVESISFGKNEVNRILMEIDLRGGMVFADFLRVDIALN